MKACEVRDFFFLGRIWGGCLNEMGTRPVAKICFQRSYKSWSPEVRVWRASNHIRTCRTSLLIQVSITHNQQCKICLSCGLFEASWILGWAPNSNFSSTLVPFLLETLSITSSFRAVSRRKWLPGVGFVPFCSPSISEFLYILIEDACCWWST